MWFWYISPLWCIFFIRSSIFIKKEESWTKSIPKSMFSGLFIPTIYTTQELPMNPFLGSYACWFFDKSLNHFWLLFMEEYSCWKLVYPKLGPHFGKSNWCFKSRCFIAPNFNKSKSNKRIRVKFKQKWIQSQETDTVLLFHFNNESILGS